MNLAEIREFKAVALFVSAHTYCASKFIRNVVHNSDRADGHCYRPFA